MNKHLQNIVGIIQQDESLSAEQKNAILKSLKDADKELEVATFKLDRTEKVKRTTTILLEETIAELEQKRRAVEEQKHELEIEAALEKVRSRSLAMNHSNELELVAGSLFDRLAELGLSFDGALIFIFDREKRNISLWIATNHLSAPVKIDLPYDKSIENNTIIKDLWNSIEKGEHIINRSYSGEVKNDYFRYVAKHNESKIPESIRQLQLEKENWTAHFVAEKNSMIGFDSWSGHSTKEEDFNILIRFAKVFEQAYTRFLDLQRAEAQAKEATIETALEKVRGEAMAMHNSNDLLATARRIFSEVRKLGITPIRCGVGLLTKDSKVATIYRSTSSAHGDDFLYAATVTLDGHPVITEIYNSTINGEACFPVLKGELLKSYYEKVVPDLKAPEMPPDYTEYGYFLSFTEGFFYGWSGKPIIEADIKILDRFKLIIDLTFRRYLELQKAEANAIEAVRRSSLDRVRAEIASMRTTGDLERITPVIWNELTTLGVPFIRCGILIIDEHHQQIHVFLSTPDGKAITSFNTPFSKPGTLTETVPYWRKKEIYKTHWDEVAFIEQAKVLVEQGAISSPEKYLTENRPTSLYLHFLPFLQGMLYVGNDAPLSDEQLQLVQTLADTFSTAYSRYEDFNKLESANIKIEKTLIDLKQTQAQLVQSEKMASLGELTAGIAHEIQNPLNFVNNFSEVSNELLDEMKEEIDKGNYDEVKAITNDVMQNLEKVLHHGKRADAIVKGMLQHSRSSSGVKEPTDINALADEYLRLAYHGLRAKDKSLNATLNTDYDQTIGNINVVPQDIGRVILNLINNAFYAVSERLRQALPASGYQPNVIVSTKKTGNRVLISVKDNGNGIPESIKEKIFQPFFTTKPTGLGTGLGLSLSYDIVKAHGGELKVNTKEGEGSEFIIQLPIV